MSDEALEELVVKLSADLSSFTSSMNTMVAKAEEAGKHVESKLGAVIEKSLLKVEIALELLKKGFEFVKEATVDMVREQLTAVDHLAKLSDRTGVTTEALTALGIAAEESGLTIDDMAMSLQRMGRQLNSAAKGTGPAADALQKLGLTVRELRDLKPDEQMARISDAFANIQSPAERSTIAMELFGRAGLQMVGFLSKGSEGLEEAKKKAVEFGLSLDRVDAAKVEMANNAWREMRDRLEGAARVLTVQLAPILKDVADHLGTWITKMGGVRSIMERVINFCIKVVGAFLDVMNDLAISWQFVIVAAETIPAAVEAVMNAVGKTVVDAIKAIELAVASMIEATAAKVNKLPVHIKGVEAGLTAIAGKIRESANNIKADAGTIGTVWEKMAADSTASLVKMRAALPPSARVKAYYEELQVLAQHSGKQFIEIHQQTNDAMTDLDEAWFAARVDALKEGVNEETIAENKRFEDLKRDTQQAFEDAQTDQGTRDAITERQAKEHQAKLSAISNNAAQQRANFEAHLRATGTADLTSTLNSVSTLLEQHGKKQFEMGKKIAYASAIISVAQGAAKTIADYGWYALLGPLEAVLAAGAVQISAISRQTYNGGGSAPSSGGAGSPSAPSTSSTPGVTGQASGGQGLNFNIVGNVFDANTIRSIAQQMDQAIRDGVHITGVRTN